MSIEQKLKSLNEMQRKGVLKTEGPLLLLAGAGSGKTRVLTYRIAYLIEKGVNPWNILAITFTNKAAREMRERAAAITPRGNEVWVSTFHSTCVRILRREIDKIGWSNQFSIYDADDSERLIKDILKELNISDKMYPPKYVQSVISSQKDTMTSPEEFASETEKDFRLKRVADIYRIYQKRLKDNNALDFDDLIYMTVRLFEERPDILDKYQERFRYIMVDEYQDTNGSQYELVRLLAKKYRNICVVGDDDQSIYGWRGADIRNILSFKEDYNEAVVYKLEQNYRSTQQILDAANSVIKNNRHDELKSLWTDRSEGEKIIAYRAEDDRFEAEYICSEIDRGVSEGREYKDFAILYRNNALSRVIEERLIKNGIPYRLFGGTRFYDRKEIRDIMSYLKTVYNPNDDIAIRRIINVPKRGIGDTTVNKIMEYAIERDMSFYRALCECENIDSLSPAAVKKLMSFRAMLDGLREAAEDMDVSSFIERVTEDTGYKAELEAENTDISRGRLENLEELINKAVEFEENAEENKDLSAFLEEVALVADVDAYTEGDDTVVLMTLHSSKGLEFDTVFIAGFEENIFPGYRALTEGDITALEEERRLCYVGITRAKKRLYVTSAVSRLQHGNYVANAVSRFVKEIPTELVEFREQGVRNIKESKPLQGRERYVNNFKRPVNAYKMPEPKNFTLDYGVGDTVKHLKFGKGKVIAIAPGGADYEVTVEFDTHGAKKLMAKLAGLKKI